MRRTTLPLVAALLVTAAALAWLWSSQRDSAAPPALAIPATPDREVAEETPSPAAQPLAPEKETAEETAAVAADERTPLAADPDDPELAGAIWVEGVLVVPADTPADEDVVVVARGRRFDSRDFHGARPDARGRFRVAFSPRTKRGHLLVEARYLYLERGVTVRTGELPEEIRLTPRLGGRMSGRLVLPPGSPPAEEALRDLEIQLEGRDPSAAAGSEGAQRAATIRPDATWVADALPANRVYRVHLRSPVFADQRRAGVSVEPGATASLDLELVLGATVAGRVVDETGAPLEGARIAAQGGVGGSAPWLGRIDSGADGSFRLRGVDPGPLVVRAHYDGYLNAEVELEELAPGASVEGVEMVMRSGRGITGRVLWPDGTPAARAAVEARRRPDPGQSPWEVWGDVERGRAERDGTFRISGLVEGSYDLYASARRAAPAEAGAHDEPGRAGAQAGRPESITWVASLEDVSIDGGDLLLTLEAGRALAGRVVDDRGQPVTAYRIQSRLRGDSTSPLPRTGLGARRNERFTDPEGRFVLLGLQEGSWGLEVFAEGYASTVREVAIPAAEAEIEIALARAGVARGVVLAHDGAPVPGATVNSNTERARAFSTWAWRQGEATRADDEGRFELDDLPPGAVLVRASAPGHGASEPVEIQVEAGVVVEDLVIELRAGGRLTGQVSPAVGVVENREIDVNERDQGFHLRVSTDADGRFELDHLSPGSYDVTLVARGDETPALPDDPSFARRGRPVPVTVEVREGETAHVVLGAPPENAIVLHGVVSSGGTPVPGTGVEARRRGEHGRGAATAVTDPAGRYELVVDGPGDYVFRVGADKASRASVHATVPDASEHRLDLELPTASVSGAVHAPAGEPAAGCTVTLVFEAPLEGGEPSFESREDQADDEGRFRFTHLPPGRYVLRAGQQAPWAYAARGSAEWAPRIVPDVRVEPGAAVADLEVRLGASATLRGVVLDAGGEPVPGIGVRLVDENQRDYSSYGLSAFTGPDGRFEIRAAPTGRVHVSASRPDASSPVQTVELHEGGEAEVELVLGG